MTRQLFRQAVRVLVMVIAPLITAPSAGSPLPPSQDQAGLVALIWHGLSSPRSSTSTS